MNDKSASLHSPATRDADLKKDTETLDMFATLFDPHVVSDFVKNSQHVENQDHRREDQEDDETEEDRSDTNENDQTLNKKV